MTESEPETTPSHDVFQAPRARLGESSQKTYSGLGLASLCLSILAGLGIFGAIAYAVYIQVTTGAEITSQRGTMMLVGLAMIGCVLLGIVGIVLGTVGLFQANRRKLLPVLGLIFNVLVFLMFGVLYAIGVSVS